MISYKIDLHDITALTAPMFDACGIECPAMIGATCPADVGDGSYRRCPGWSAKFGSAAAEVVHSWTLDSGQSDTCGDSVMGNAWHALFRNPDAGTHGTDPMGAGLILTELSSGAVELTVFDSAEELTEVWAKITAEYDDGCPGHGPGSEDGPDFCDGSCITDEPTDADEEPGMIR